MSRWYRVGAGGEIFLGGVSEAFPADRMYVQKLDASGNHLWLRTYSNGAADYGYAVDCDGSGNVYLGGSSATAFPIPTGTSTGMTTSFESTTPRAT